MMRASDPQRSLPNLFASPSIFITSRSPSAPALIRAISKDRILVESDSADVKLSTQLVWAATEWIARCKGWKLESDDAPDWSFSLEAGQEALSEVWAVRTLERNWARFMRLDRRDVDE